MLLPPLTDLGALLGIDLVLCAVCLRLLSGRNGVTLWAKWAVMAFFVILWIPFGTAQLPLLAYVRGISSDLSTTLVALACLSLGRPLFDWPAVAEPEKMALYMALAVAAAVLYPTALGWGDWDAYREFCWCCRLPAGLPACGFCRRWLAWHCWPGSQDGWSQAISGII